MFEIMIATVMMVATVFQTIAAGTQAAAAILFFKTVQQKRRDDIIRSLHDLWCQTPDGPTPEELSGCPFSQRQIDFFNSSSAEWVRHGVFRLSGSDTRPVRSKRGNNRRSLSGP
jgi:hypothetical protein